MSFPNRRRAIRRSALAAAVGVALIALFGSQFVLPGVALVAKLRARVGSSKRWYNEVGEGYREIGPVPQAWDVPTES